MDYEKLWNTFKSRLVDVEQYGNLAQQTIANAYLEIMLELEQGAKNTEQPKMLKRFF